MILKIDIQGRWRNINKSTRKAHKSLMVAVKVPSEDGAMMSSQKLGVFDAVS